MRSLVPAPLASATLFAAWLMLNQSASPGNLVLAALFALALPQVLRAFSVDPPRLRRPAVAARLALRVLSDIVVANLEVALRILGPEARLKSRFVRVPLSIRHPHGRVALAGIVTLTPGTLSADIAGDLSDDLSDDPSGDPSGDRAHLLVHALDVADERELVESIKRRYEAPLMEIFEP